MLPIEEVNIVKVRDGSCCRSDVVTSLPNSSWKGIFAAINRMLRYGRVFLARKVNRLIRLVAAEWSDIVFQAQSLNALALNARLAKGKDARRCTNKYPHNARRRKRWSRKRKNLWTLNP
jgi:hypothetical protein